MENLVEPDRIPKDFMGIVRADLLLENSEDRTIYERGLIGEDEIRSLTVTGIKRRVRRSTCLLGA